MLRVVMWMKEYFSIHKPMYMQILLQTTKNRILKVIRSIIVIIFRYRTYHSTKADY